MQRKEKNKRDIEYSFRMTLGEAAICDKNISNALVSSKAEYLRKLALNEPIQSKIDYLNYRQFLRVAGEQGKLVGLLRIFLMKYEITKDNEKKILQLIEDIEQSRDKLRKIADKISL